MIKIFQEIKEELKKEIISPKLVLGRCQLVNPFDKMANAFTDHKNLPFYYYLGKYLPRNTLLNFGFGMGLPIIFYILANRPTHILVQQQKTKDFYSSNLGEGNVFRTINKKVKNIISDCHDETLLKNVKQRTWGSILINTSGLTEKQLMDYLDLSWDNMSDDGYICIDYAFNNREIIKNFSRLINRPEHFIGSRYGHSIIFKQF